MSPLTLFIPLYLIGIFISGKSKKAGAIYNLCWTCGILIYAIAVISDGGQLALFNLALPNFVVILILLATMASEIYTLVKVLKEPSPAQVVEQLNSEPPAEGAEVLEGGKSAEVYLSRPRRFVANGVMNSIVFNDRQYGMLANGKDMTLVTQQSDNRLEVFCGLKSAVFTFTAAPGERYVITVEDTMTDVILRVESPFTAEISSKKDKNA